MNEAAKERARAFKTAWFSKAAKKAHIADEMLCATVQQAILGQADDLGGGVFKKRLGRDLYRAILLARAGQYWIYAYLFAKQDRANIDEDELAAFRSLAGLYSRKTGTEIARELKIKELVEIYSGEKSQVQK